MKRWPWLVLLGLLVGAGCGGASESGSVRELPAESAGESVSPDGERRFDVDGAEVWTRLEVDELPEGALRVEFVSFILDQGTGPTACFGAINDSYRPGCDSGLQVDGLVMGIDWTEASHGVTWGRRVIMVSWPPVDGVIELVADRAVEETPGPTDPFVREVQVKGDLEEVRRELATDSAQPCLVSVQYSHRELRSANNAIEAMARQVPNSFIGVGTGDVTNRITVVVPVAALATIRSIVEIVDDPAMLRIHGSGRILDGG